MGYNSTLSGQLIITPPLKWAQFKDTVWAGWEHAQESGMGLCFLIHCEKMETDEGFMELRETDTIEFAWSCPVKLYNIVTELQEIADLCRPGHSITGTLYGRGETWGDIWRLYVNDAGRAVQEAPTIQWADGITSPTGH